MVMFYDTVQLYIWGQIYLLLMARYSCNLACDWSCEGSLVPRCHPAHMSRRGLVLQVEILWLATWSGQSNCRVAFIGKSRGKNKYFSNPAQSDIMRFLIQHLPVCNILQQAWIIHCYILSVSDCLAWLCLMDLINMIASFEAILMVWCLWRCIIYRFKLLLT